MQISLRIEINVKNALLGLLLLPFIIPSTLMQLIPQLNSMIFYLRLVSTAMIFLCYIERRERGIVVFEALNFLFAAFLILVSAYNGRSWGGGYNIVAH